MTTFFFYKRCNTIVSVIKSIFLKKVILRTTSVQFKLALGTSLFVFVVFVVLVMAD